MKHDVNRAPVTGSFNVRAYQDWIHGQDWVRAAIPEFVCSQASLAYQPSLRATNNGFIAPTDGMLEQRPAFLLGSVKIGYRDRWL